jgi:quinol monooxygenase YgiN
MIYVIASIKLKPGVREKFLEIFQANVPNVLAEDGCLSYEPCVDVVSDLVEADPDVVTVVEEWESIKHLKAHLAAPHMKKYGAAVADLRLSTSLKIVENA